MPYLSFLVGFCNTWSSHQIHPFLYLVQLLSYIPPVCRYSSQYCAWGYNSTCAFDNTWVGPCAIPVYKRGCLWVVGVCVSLSKLVNLVRLASVREFVDVGGTGLVGGMFGSTFLYAMTLHWAAISFWMPAWIISWTCLRLYAHHQLTYSLCAP